jgi:hypothetical protein
MSGTWWVNSGRDFAPDQAESVAAAGYASSEPLGRSTTTECRAGHGNRTSARCLVWAPSTLNSPIRISRLGERSRPSWTHASGFLGTGHTTPPPPLSSRSSRSHFGSGNTTSRATREAAREGSSQTVHGIYQNGWQYQPGAQSTRRESSGPALMAVQNAQSL